MHRIVRQRPRAAIVSQAAAAALLASAMLATTAGAQVADNGRVARDTAVLRRVVVTATRDSTLALATPLPTAVLGGRELRLEHGVSLARVLSRLPGARALSTGEQVGKPVIRGLSGARVLTLDDGLRLEDYSWSDEDGPSVDARLADRVELVRGPASVLYGSDALGGVVNVLPPALPDARGTAPVRRGEAEVYGASATAEGGGVLRVDGASGRWAGRAVGVGRVGQDVRTPAGDIPNTGFLAFNAEAAGAVRRASGSTTARIAHYGGEFKLLETDGPPPAAGRADAEGGPARVTLDDRLQVTHVASLGTGRLGGVTLEARGQWQRHLLQEKADVPNPPAGQPPEATVFDLLLNTGTAELLARHGERGGRLRGTVGASALYQRNDTRGIEPLVPDARVTSGALFAFERIEVGRLSVLAGARGDLRRLTTNATAGLAAPPGTHDYDAATGDVGVVFAAAPGLALAMNAGRAWRAPTLFELYADGPRIGEGRYEVGRASLVPETSLDLDASARWERGRWTGELSAFHNRVDDFIYVAPTGGVRDGLRVYDYRQTAATLAGGELSLGVRPLDALSLYARGDVVRGTRAGGDRLPSVPPARALAGSELHGRGAHAVTLGAEVEAVAPATRLSSEERDAVATAAARYPLSTAGYALVSVTAGAEWRTFGRNVRTDLRVRNIGDVRYRDYLDRYKSFAYAPGVNAVLRVSTAF